MDKQWSQNKISKRIRLHKIHQNDMSNKIKLQHYRHWRNKVRSVHRKAKKVSYGSKLMEIKTSKSLFSFFKQFLYDDQNHDTMIKKIRTTPRNRMILLLLGVLLCYNNRTKIFKQNSWTNKSRAVFLLVLKKLLTQ